MRVTLDELLWNVRVADGLDVLVLSLMIYLVWRWFQRRATHAMAIAVLGVGALYTLSKALSMYLTIAVFQAGLTVIMFALVVIFQDDLRHALDRLSSWRPLASRSPEPSTERFLHMLVETMTLLAAERTGALIVLPGREPLERHIRGGVRVDGVASLELLHSIFDPSSRGHDGGVILRNERVHRLGVHLPLSANLSAVGSRGTRHTAALGLAERTDALVIVVSEERGSIALAQGSNLDNIESAAELESRLLSFFETQSSESGRRITSREKLARLGAQAGSLCMAVILWFVFAFQVETVQRTVEDVPVEFRNLREEWSIEDATPSKVRLTLVGPQRAFDAFDPNTLKAAVEIRDGTGGPSTIPIREEHLDLPQGIHLRAASPATIRLQLSRQATRAVPIDVVTEGQPPEGWELAAIAAEPDSVMVHIPSPGDDEISLQTEPVDLSDVRSTKTVTARIQFPPGVRPVRDTDRAVQIRIEVRPPPNSPGDPAAAGDR